MKKLLSRAGVKDCLFLFGVVFLSSLPYLANLGFHGDDWWNQADLTEHSSLGTVGLFVHEWRGDFDALVRPVMVAYDVLCFEAFGHRAWPVHVVNMVVLGLATALLYLVLRKLKIERWTSFAIALVFGLLPHYSTDRFWAAAHQAALCMALALLGIYALLRSEAPEEAHPNRWLTLAVLANILSVLAYEVALGLIVGAIVWVVWSKVIVIRRQRASSFAGLSGAAVVALALILIGIPKVRLQHRLTHPHHFGALISRLVGLSKNAIIQAFAFNFSTYGIKLPQVLFRLVERSALSVAAFITAIVICVCVAIYMWRNMPDSAVPGRRTSLGLVGLGLVVFGLGYVLFLSSLNFNFSSAGINNRVAIAAAPGVACILVGIAGLACSFLKSYVLASRLFSLYIALVCGLNSLVVSGIAFFWADAAAQQAYVLRSVTTNVRSLPKGSVLLLDGFCRFSGPGVVFESDGDTSGALKLAMGDYSLNADVVSSNMTFNADTVDTTFYGAPAQHYPYSDRLFVYDVRYKKLTLLPSQSAAEAYLQTRNPTGDGGCPAAREGDGEKVF